MLFRDMKHTADGPCPLLHDAAVDSTVSSFFFLPTSYHTVPVPLLCIYNSPATQERITYRAYLPAGEESPPGTCLSALTMPSLVRARHSEDGLGESFPYLLVC